MSASPGFALRSRPGYATARRQTVHPMWAGYAEQKCRHYDRTLFLPCGRDVTLDATKNGRGETSVSQHAPMRVATPDGVCVSVGEWGNPAGPEIVFIPGLAQSVLSFNRQTDSALAHDFRIIAYDLRGHGLSDKPTDPACYQDGRRWADELAAVIAAKRLRRPVLVGWSLGGRVLRQYLMHYGDGALSGINFLASRPIEDPGIVGPASKAMQGDTSRDLAGRIAASLAFLRACYEKQPDEADFITAVAYNFMCRSRSATRSAAGRPIRTRYARPSPPSRCRRWSRTAGATG